MIESKHLLHIMAVAEHRHFGRAAEAVHLTQPALTRSIQTAERSLGVRLFDRSRSGVEPTPFGRMVIERAGPIVNELRNLEREIGLQRDLASGSLSVSLAPYPSELSGKTAIARLLEAHPRIRCRIQLAHFAQVTASVAAGDSDLGFAELSVAAEDPNLETELVVTRPASFFCRPDHPLAERAEASLEDLTAYPWVTTRWPRRLNTFLPADVDRAGSWDDRTGEFVPAIETNVLYGLTELATESDALVGATATIVESHLRAKRLRRVPFEAQWFRFHHGFITRLNRTLPPLAQEFMRRVRSIEAELDEREAELWKEFK